MPTPAQRCSPWACMAPGLHGSRAGRRRAHNARGRVVQQPWMAALTGTRRRWSASTCAPTTQHCHTHSTPLHTRTPAHTCALGHARDRVRVCEHDHRLVEELHLVEWAILLRPAHKAPDAPRAHDVGDVACVASRRVASRCARGCGGGWVVARGRAPAWGRVQRRRVRVWSGACCGTNAAAPRTGCVCWCATVRAQRGLCGVGACPRC